jgi:transposase
LNYLNDKNLTPLISQLIELSSLPLRAVEKDFAVDSTGFSTSRYSTWLDIRTQKRSKKRVWKKAHIIIGTKTNTITSVLVTDGVAADSPHLVPLLDKTRIYFDMREVSADKAYSSRGNLQAISDAGAMPLIPFKSNSNSKSKGCMVWKMMYKFFTENRKEFEKHYHKRSNVESTNSMIKRKFSNHLKGRKHTAQTNEILMKCLCHNLCVLIQEAFELGIEIDLNSCARDYFAQKKD